MMADSDQIELGFVEVFFKPKIITLVQHHLVNMKGGIFNARSDKEEIVLMHAGAILKVQPLQPGWPTFCLPSNKQLPTCLYECCLCAHMLPPRFVYKRGKHEHEWKAGVSKQHWVD